MRLFWMKFDWIEWNKYNRMLFILPSSQEAEMQRFCKLIRWRYSRSQYPTEVWTLDAKLSKWQARWDCRCNNYKMILGKINSFLIRFKACSIWGNLYLVLHTKIKNLWLGDYRKAICIFVKWMCCACPLVFWTFVSESIDHGHSSSWRETFLQMIVYPR